MDSVTVFFVFFLLLFFPGKNSKMMIQKNLCHFSCLVTIIQQRKLVVENHYHVNWNWILVPVCHVQPRGIIRNATFIVGVDDVNFSDFKADDLGSWVTKGTEPLSFDLSLMDQYVYLPESLLFKKDHHTRRYYTHAT